MDLDAINKKTRTCFKCEKKNHICRFWKNKEKDLANVESENKASQIKKKNLEEN